MAQQHPYQQQQLRLLMNELEKRARIQQEPIYCENIPQLNLKAGNFVSWKDESDDLEEIYIHEMDDVHDQQIALRSIDIASHVS